MPGADSMLDQMSVLRTTIESQPITRKAHYLSQEQLGGATLNVDNARLDESYKVT
jgi:hypothetical protein